MQIYAVSITIRIVVSYLTLSLLFDIRHSILTYQQQTYIPNFFMDNFGRELWFFLIPASTRFPFWQVGFMLLALIWKFDFPPFMVLIIAILNDGLYFSFSIYLSIFIFFIKKK